MHYKASTTKKVTFLGYCSGIGASDSACEMGALTLQAYFSKNPLNFASNWEEMLYPKNQLRGLDAIPEIVELSQRLAEKSQQLVTNRQIFIVFGGDHTSAIGTWSGAAAGLKKKGPLGLIWIDAHMDSHTPTTSVSLNLHGMSLAILLGHGDTNLTNILNFSPKILPQNVCLIGVRSYEDAEAKLLKHLGVTVFYMDDLVKKGLNVVFDEALEIVKENSVAFGVSLDLDAIDPIDAPGTGYWEPNGIAGKELCDSLFPLLKKKEKLCGFEISEYNPSRDINNRTAQLVFKIINQIFG